MVEKTACSFYVKAGWKTCIFFDKYNCPKKWISGGTINSFLKKVRPFLKKVRPCWKKVLGNFKKVLTFFNEVKTFFFCSTPFFYSINAYFLHNLLKLPVYARNMRISLHILFVCACAIAKYFFLCWKYAILALES